MNYIPESPSLAIMWCPVCEPDRDPTREILETRWCHRHCPNADGTADGAVPMTPRVLATSGDADGHDCRELQRLLYADE